MVKSHPSNKKLEGIKVKDLRLEKIERRWLDDMGIGHPISEEELQDDIQYLVKELQETRRLLAVYVVASISHYGKIPKD